MRTLKKMAVALFILGLVGIYDPVLAQNWHPISRISEKEASLIEQTVAVLKISVELSKVEYYRLDGDYVALRSPHEDRFIGPLSSNTDKQSIKSTKENDTSYIDKKDTQSATKNNKQEEYGDCWLNELHDRWGNNPDDISDEVLEKLDNLVNAAVRLCPPGSLNTIALGLRGNAFLKYINNQSFSVKDLMFFWDSYISSDRARTVDFPTIEDIRFAIDQIRDIVLNNPEYNIRILSTAVAIIRIHDKETYELLKNRKLTSY